MSINKSEQVALQQAIQAVEDNYRTACRELARLSAISANTDGYSDELEQAMYPHAVNRLEARGQLLDMGYSNTQLTAIELAAKLYGRIDAAHNQPQEDCPDA